MPSRRKPGGPCCCLDDEGPPPDCVPARHCFVVKASVIDCEGGDDPIPIAGATVTAVPEGGGTTLMGTTGADGIVCFTASQLLANGCRFYNVSATRGGCTSTSLRVYVDDVESTHNLPALTCSAGYSVAWGVDVECCCPGDEFAVTITSSDGNSTTATVTCPGASGTVCWPDPPGGYPVTVTIEVTGNPRPPVYDGSGTDSAVIADSGGIGSVNIAIGLTEDYVCCGPPLGGRPVPRTLYVNDEFGQTTLTFSASLNCVNNVGFESSPCGWCGEGLSTGDPDAVQWQDCGGFDLFVRGTFDVPVYYRLELPGVGCHGLPDTDDPPGSTWRFVRWVGTRPPSGLFDCLNVTGFRPCAPAVPGTDCATYLPAEPRPCCDHDPCADMFGRGLRGRGYTSEDPCGDDAWLLEFTLTGPTDGTAPGNGLAFRTDGIQKYTNGSATVTD